MSLLNIPVLTEILLLFIREFLKILFVHFTKNYGLK